ncbi:uncharacterized protein sh2d7 [Genypterus blacodes]|uniref:uncharacterized protein sh2d7 n=1 Tax=Genypterus blacodes TaxID=154954 RepID=UPI003F769E2E
MEKKLGVDLQMEMSDGGLKELVLRWFTETQASIILHNGNFPDWFQGFAARKDAEDLLRDKVLGSFLIRLSDKAIGYILSYKGYDRCRHFVITQNQDGLFVVSGDCQTHRSLTELIHHYKVSPIEPFGECLTSSCHEINTDELYDVVRLDSTGLSGVNVDALRRLWDQKTECDTNPGSNQRFSQQNDLPPVLLPALPQKSKTRKLTGTVSVGVMSLSPVVPPVPKRGVPLSHTLSETLPDTSYTIEVQRELNRMERMKDNAKPPQMADSVEDLSSSTPSDTSHHLDMSTMGVLGLLFSKLTQGESRSKSLPILDNNIQEEDTNQISNPQAKRVTCQTYSIHKSRDGEQRNNSRHEQQADMCEMSKPNPLYHAAEGHCSVRQEHYMYSEVTQGPTPPSRRLPDNTYEQIPGEGVEIQGNTYETLEDFKTKKSKSTWGKANMKRKILPESVKK